MIRWNDSKKYQNFTKKMSNKYFQRKMMSATIYNEKIFRACIMNDVVGVRRTMESTKEYLIVRNL